MASPTSSIGRRRPSTGSTCGPRRPPRSCAPGRPWRGAKVGDPKLLATGGPDVVVVDSKNALWRWRPADSKGKGTLARIRVAESATWGADILAIGTYVRNADDGLYNLYVLDPSEQQILRYSPAQDGSGYPAPASGYLTTPQDVSAVTSMYIDGEVYLADGGVIERFVSGRSGDWSPEAPPDDLLRPAPAYRVITSPGTRGEGSMYGYDHVSDRIIAFDKASGKYQAQFRIAGQGKDWADLRAFFVVNRASGQAPILYWIDAQRIGVATLQDISTPPTPPPAASGAPRRIPGGLGQADREAQADRDARPVAPATGGARRSARDVAWDNRPMSGRMVEMSVESVRVHMLSTQHVVILKDLARPRFLPIWIGPWEANAIAMRLQGLTAERPLTHDLFAGVLAELGATIREVVIADLADETFHARIILEAGGRVVEVDSRPSDALALAVRTGVRIFATEEVLDRAGVEGDGDDDEEAPDEERLSIFRDFVNSLDAEPGSSGPREGPPLE